MSENPLMELRYALDRSTPALKRAVATHPSYRSGGPEHALRHPSCGFATALLQRYLERECDISTQRLRSTSILDAPKRPSAQHPYDHVILVSEEFDALIDPTWTQFTALAGLHSLAVRNLPEQMRAPLYPSSEQIALAPIADYKKIGQKIVDHCFNPDVNQAIIQAIGPIAKNKNARFPAGMTYNEVASIITDIWNVEKYSSFELPDADITTSLFQRAEEILFSDSDTGI